MNRNDGSGKEFRNDGSGLRVRRHSLAIGRHCGERCRCGFVEFMRDAGAAPVAVVDPERTRRSETLSGNRFRQFRRERIDPDLGDRIEKGVGIE